MKLVQTTLIAGLSFFLSTGISFAVDMDDIELTIRVVETDDIEEMHNELSLPDAASDTAREHAEDDDGRGLTQANAAHEEHENESEHKDDAHDEEREEHEEHDDDGDEREEDKDDREDEHGDADEEEDHEKEHDNEDDGDDVAGSPGTNQ